MSRQRSWLFYCAERRCSMPGRELTIKKYNLDLYDPFETDGPFEMPFIKKTEHIPDKLIGFNEAISSKNYQSGIHMFIDDYQFERIWNTPKRYALRKPPFESERLFDLLKNISLNFKRYLSILLIQGAFFIHE